RTVRRSRRKRASDADEHLALRRTNGVVDSSHRRHASRQSGLRAHSYEQSRVGAVRDFLRAERSPMKRTACALFLTILGSALSAADTLRDAPSRTTSLTIPYAYDSDAIRA